MDVVKVILLVVAVLGATGLVGLTVTCTATVDVIPLPLCDAVLDTLLRATATIRGWLGR